MLPSDSTPLAPNGELQVQTFLSDGSGGYTASATQHLQFPAPAAADTTVSMPQVMDVNDDGKLDLLYRSFVAYGKGDGTFQQPIQLSFLASGFSSSYAADINGDGKLDIVAVNTPAGDVAAPVQYQVTTFLHQGPGAFSKAGVSAISQPSPGLRQDYELLNVFGLSFVDLNGDGKLDMVSQSSFVPVGNAASQNNLNLMFNNGDGSFAAPIAIAAPNVNGKGYNLGPYSITYGPLGNAASATPSLALAYMGNDGNVYVAVLAGDGTGNFPQTFIAQMPPTGAPNAPGSGSPGGIVLTDWNEDGHLDIVLGNGTLLAGKGDGTFQFATSIYPNLPDGSSPLGSYPLVNLPANWGARASLVFLNLNAEGPAVLTNVSESSAAFPASALAPGTHTITAAYSGDAIYQPSTSPPVTVTIPGAASAISITSSANPSYVGESVTFMAKVTSSGGSPGGSVVFSTGSARSGTIPLSGGAASYAIVFASAGDETVTAAYSGDAVTTPAQATISEGIVPALSMTPGDGGTALSVKSGDSVTNTMRITGNAGFSGAVTLACTGLPAHASCQFNPATVMLAGAAASTTLTVNTAAVVTMAGTLLPASLGGGALATACLIFLPLIGPRRNGRRLVRLLFAVGTTVALAGWGAVGCGAAGNGGSGGTTPSTTPAGTYTFNVIASSGAAQTSTSYTLTIQ